jgi:hypothetical protein
MLTNTIIAARYKKYLENVISIDFVPLLFFVADGGVCEHVCVCGGEGGGGLIAISLYPTV